MKKYKTARKIRAKARVKATKSSLNKRIKEALEYGYIPSPVGFSYTGSKHSI